MKVSMAGGDNINGVIENNQSMISAAS